MKAYRTHILLLGRILARLHCHSSMTSEQHKQHVLNGRGRTRPPPLVQVPEGVLSIIHTWILDTGDLSVSDLTFNSSNDLAFHELSQEDEALTSSILYENLGSESDLESIHYGRSLSSGLRSASLDASNIDNISTPLALHLPPIQLSAQPLSPTPTATTPIAPNQLQKFFPESPESRTGNVRPNSSLSLQLKPNYYSRTTHNHSQQHYQGPPK